MKLHFPKSKPKRLMIIILIIVPIFILAICFANSYLEKSEQPVQTVYKPTEDEIRQEKLDREWRALQQERYRIISEALSEASKTTPTTSQR